MERGPRRAGGPKPRRLTQTPLANIDWLLAEHGSITLSELTGLGCVAAAADHHLCYAMLVRRKTETVSELLNRLDGAIATAAESNTTIDEVNPPGGFKSTRP
jgi:hypothetical protein